MSKRPLLSTALAAGLILSMGVTAPAQRKAKEPEEETQQQPQVERPAPYDDKLLRLAEILGSVHYLRNLCAGGETDWREMMARLLEEETKGEPQRAARLTAGFNRGFRAFASTYTKCTTQAVAAEEKYRAEGATLAAEITARYGN